MTKPAVGALPGPWCCVLESGTPVQCTPFLLTGKWETHEKLRRSRRDTREPQQDRHRKDRRTTHKRSIGSAGETQDKLRRSRRATRTPKETRRRSSIYTREA